MRNASGNVVNPPPAPLSRQKAQFMKAFERAKSVDEMLKAFKNLEASFDESDLGMECWILARKLINEDHDIEEGFRFGKRALQIFLANVDKEKPCFGKYVYILNICTNCQTPNYFISRVCNLLGSACLKLKRYGESLSYLNWAIRNFTKLEKDYDSSCIRNCVLHGILDSQYQLYFIKMTNGRYGEAAVHIRTYLEVKEKLTEEDCIQLGEINMNVYMAYYAADDFEAALPFCLKALEIHEKHLGRDSGEVGKIRNALGFIYRQLGQYDKALEQKRLSLSLIKDTGSISHDSLMDLGRYEEAIDLLEGDVSRDDIEEEKRALLFLAMAKAFVKLGKFTDAKKRMRSVKNILEKEGMSPSFVAHGLGEMSHLYQELNDPETALSFVRRAIAIPDVPKPILSQNASILFSLISRSRKVKEVIPYLKDVVEKLEASFGPVHFEVGCGYTSLGLAYCHSGQQELGAKFLKNAKDIMDATFWPNRIYSLRESQTLSLTYARMGRHGLAMDIQEKIIEGLKGSGEQAFMDEAVTNLNKMKVGAAQSLTSATPQFRDCEDPCATISKCGISDAGRNQVNVGE